ncbi:MAG: UDP-N-acetylglucosamine 2-epimerase (non-hydrolyzing) [Bdellovibrionia bacterium]
MKRLRVMTIVGTRPEIIKLSRIISKLDENTDHVLVHTGQNYDYELNEIFFKDLEIRKPDHFLSAAGPTAAQTIAKVIEKVDPLLEEVKPDAVLLYGDTNSCLSVIPAKRRQIPVFHMEAGNRCFDQRVPEELNRKIVDHLSDINMPLTEHGRRYLLAEGIRPETVFKIGSTMKEVLSYYRPKIEAARPLERLSLMKGEYFLVSLHREENVDSEKNLRSLVESLKVVVTKYNKQIVVSTHPRTQKRLAELELKDLDSRIQFLKPFGFLDYAQLQMQAYCVLSDSGTITEESSLMGFTAVMVRQAHERPEGVDSGVAVMSGFNTDRMLQAIDFSVKVSADNKVVQDYDTDAVSTKVLKIILGYVDYVNRTVWHKQVD